MAFDIPDWVREPVVGTARNPARIVEPDAVTLDRIKEELSLRAAREHYWRERDGAAEDAAARSPTRRRSAASED